MSKRDLQLTTCIPKTYSATKGSRQNLKQNHLVKDPTKRVDSSSLKIVGEDGHLSCLQSSSFNLPGFLDSEISQGFLHGEMIRFDEFYICLFSIGVAKKKHQKNYVVQGKFAKKKRQ